MPHGYREALYASPAVTALDTGVAEVATITMNQQARYVDLDRLTALVCMNAITATGHYPTTSFADKISIGENSKLRGSEPLVVGRNTPFGALNLDPRRARARMVRFGRQPFASQDTIAIEAIVRGTALECDFTIAAPGWTSETAPTYNPTRAPKLLCSPTSGVIAADDATDTLTITADKAGWAWGTGLMLESLPAATATGEEVLSTDGLGCATLTSLSLPGSIELVRGSGTPEAPAAVFSNARHGDWVDVGWIYLNAGSTISFGIRNRGPDEITVSASVPFFEDDSPTKRNGC